MVEPLSHLPPQLIASMQRFLDDACIIAITDTAGRIVFANAKFCTISGYSEEELLGQNHRMLKSGQHPDSMYTELWHTISHGGTWVGEICNRAKAGHFYWVHTTISPIRSEEGRITHYASLRVDITERKRAEEEYRKLLAAQAELRRMESLGRMADGVLHDLNNMLSVALCVTMQQERSSQEDDILFPVLTRMAQLTRNLRDFASGRESPRAPFKLAGVVREVAGIVLFQDIRLRRLRCERQLELIEDVVVDGNEAQLLEVFLNLLRNASEALVNISEAWIRIRGSYDAARGMVRIFIEDNGPGVPAAVRERLFEPYSSNKGAGRGLGLSMSRRIMLSHGGQLTLEPSELGTCWMVELPATRKDLVPALNEGESRGIVLIAEDDAEVRGTLVLHLRRLGFRPVCAEHPEEAIAVADRMGAAITAAILDSAGNDREQAVIGALRRIRPDMKIVLASGSLSVSGPLKTRHGVVHGLSKPYVLEELDAVILNCTGCCEDAHTRGFTAQRD